MTARTLLANPHVVLAWATSSDKITERASSILLMGRLGYFPKARSIVFTVSNAAR